MGNEDEEEVIQTKVEFPTITNLEEESPEAGPEPEATSTPEAEGAPSGEEAADGGKGADSKVSLPAIEPLSQEEEIAPIQTKSNAANNHPNGAHSNVTHPNGTNSTNIATVLNTLHTSKVGGNPMAPGVRSEMEGHFGRDLSQVRIHTDSSSIQMNRDLSARAFTHKNDIYFSVGEYQPQSQRGKHLLAHELTHTMQQNAIGNKIQRYTAPAQQVVTEPRPEIPNDGAEVRDRMNKKIDNAPNVQDQENLSEEEHQEAQNTDRSEVRQEADEISSSGESSPSVDRGAEAQRKTEEQKTQIDQKVQEQPEEAGEEQSGKGEEESAELSQGDAASQRNLAAEAQAQSIQIPNEPEPFRHPRIEGPVDSAGEPLPRNSQIDTQIRGLAYISEMLREKGYEMKRHAAEQEIGSYGLDAVLERERGDLVNAREGTSTMESQNEARQEIADQSREALAESVERQQFVAGKAPDLASKADEGQEDSGALASEAGSKAERSQSEIPDDPEARANAEKQSGEMQNVAESAESMDQAIRQTGERARQYQQEAEAAAEQNQQSEAQIGETEDAITQTEARIEEMHSANDASDGQIQNAGPGPALIRQYSRQTAQSGDELIAATIVMEQELNALQEQYLSDMAGIESREAAIERQQREQEPAQQAEMSPEEAQLFELAGMSDEEQAQHIAEMNQHQRGGLLATLDKMIQRTPDQGTEATEGARLKVDTGLSQAIMGEQPPDPRAQQIQEVENRRIQRIGGVLDIADQNMNHLTAEQQCMLANRLVAGSITDEIKNINVLQMGKQMIMGMIDPRQSLVSIVGGFEKTLTGLANIGNGEAWQRDPLGNLLQIAADISTGLAMVFSTVLGIAGIIMTLMVALTIASLGTASPVTGPVIGWMGTVMTYAGWGAIIAGGLAVYFNYLSYIKNLQEAGTAETARELFGNTEQMKQNATDGFQGAMAVVEGIGAVKMGPKLSSKKFFNNIPRSPGQWARRTVQGVRESASSLASAPGSIARGAKALFSGGRQGLMRFKERIRGLFSHRHPGHADLDVDTPAAKQGHQANLDEARTRRVQDMNDAQFGAEMDEVGRNQPRKIDHGSEHFNEYDVEIKANGHTYRRRRDGRGWCRFTAKECGINGADLPENVRENLPDIEESPPSRTRDTDGDVQPESQRIKQNDELLGSELDENSKPKFRDSDLEDRYQSYKDRKVSNNEEPRDRLEWKERSDFWRERVERGNEFNQQRADAYPYNEVYVEKPDGSGYYRVDSYDPDMREIVSRKHTQLVEIDESTAIKYIEELPEKYPPGAKIANVPSNQPGATGPNANSGIFEHGDTLRGQMILEVPVQTNTQIPQNILDAARKNGVIIRDSTGRIYQ